MKQFMILISLLALVGCSSIKKVTGQTNDKVLPGQREDILSPDQQTARDPIVTGQEKQLCDPTIAKCPPDVTQ
jgi:uncharacterized protein YcfL